MARTIEEQKYLVDRTNAFLKKYGVYKKWLAEKVNISYSKFSYFIGNRYVIPDAQYDRLNAFLDEYERRMIGFQEIGN